MKSIYIKNGNILDIFNELKNNLNGTLTAYDKGYNITLKSEIAIGKIEGTAFDKEISYLEFDAIFHDDIKISMELSNDMPIFFTYCSKGELQHSFGVQGYKKTLKEQQTGILRSNSNTNSILHFKKNIPVKFSVIRVGLNTVGKTHNEQLIKKIKSIFSRSKEDYLEVRPQNLSIMEKINELDNVSQKGIVRNLLRNRILEIILKMEIENHTDLLSMIGQEIYSQSLKKIDQTKRITNFVMTYPIKELFIHKVKGAFKIVYLQKINFISTFMRIERPQI